MVFLNLDFEKTFDKVEHEAILQIPKAKVFGDKWNGGFLASGTSSVLLNGVPGKVLHCRRGLRQGPSIVNSKQSQRSQYPETYNTS